MKVIKARIKRLKHIADRYLEGDFKKHSCIDYVHSVDYNVVGYVFSIDKSVELRCKCGVIFYENKLKK